MELDADALWEPEFRPLFQDGVCVWHRTECPALWRFSSGDYGKMRCARYCVDLEAQEGSGQPVRCPGCLLEFRDPA